MNIDSIPHVITAACALHNICKVYHEQFNDAWLQTEGDYAQPDTITSRDTPTVDGGDYVYGIINYLLKLSQLM